MDTDIAAFARQLNQDGVDAARPEADAILAEARARAGEILEQARADAEAARAAAQATIEGDRRRFAIDIQFTLTVSKAGTGTGAVASNLPGITCGTDCSKTYASGTSVTLTATPAAGSVFAGWSGDADCADGILSLVAHRTCTPTFNALTKATLTSPAPGSTLTGSSATFTWSAGAGATQYYLQLGTSLGTSNIANLDQGTNTSTTVSGLPTDGSTIYARLWTKLAGAWQFNDYTYTALTLAKGALTSTTGGSTLTGSNVT